MSDPWEIKDGWLVVGEKDKWEEYFSADRCRAINRVAVEGVPSGDRWFVKTSKDDGNTYTPAVYSSAKDAAAAARRLWRQIVELEKGGRQ